MKKKIFETNFIMSRARAHTHTHISERQLKIIFLDVLDYSEYSDANIMTFFHENIASSMMKQKNWKIKFWKKKFIKKIGKQNFIKKIGKGNFEKKKLENEMLKKKIL